jgi:hypothetical protein
MALMVAGALTTVVWLLLGGLSREPPPRLLTIETLTLLTLLTLAAANTRRIATWLPDSQPIMADRLPAIAPPLFRFSIPAALVLLTPLYVGGTVL